MSQLFDALRRNRPRAAPPPPADRTARADAVLTTLGYRKKSSPSVVKPVALILGGLIAALGVAWYLWPPETPGRRRPLDSVRQQPPPVVTPPTAAPQAERPAGPVAAPVAALPLAPADAPLAATRPPEMPLPPAASQEPRASRGPRAGVVAAPPHAPGRVETAAAPARPPASDGIPSPPIATAAAPPPSSAELFRLALYHHRAGDFVAAETSYRALLQRNELDAQVHNNLGLLYRERGLVDDALKEFQRALLINPHYLTARNNLGVVLMGASRLDEAAAEFRRVLSEDARDIDASVNLALVEKAAGRPEQAKESLLRALAIDPRNAPAHFNLASLYEQSGEAVRALDHYRSFLEHAGIDHAARAPDARARIEALARPR